MENKLKKYLNCKELQHFFKEPVTEDEDAFFEDLDFCIDTDTHHITIRDPKITWERPYTEPDKAHITFVDAGDTCIFELEDGRFEICLNGEVSIENFTNLDLNSSVILNIEKIPIKDLLKTKELTFEIKYTPFDFGTGEDFDVTDKNIHLSGKDWRNMFAQGIPTINTKSVILFTAEIEVVEKDVEKTIEFTIPGTNKKLIVNIDSTFSYGLVDVSISDFDESNAESLLSISKVQDANELHISVKTDQYETQNLYRELT